MHRTEHGFCERMGSGEVGECVADARWEGEQRDGGRFCWCETVGR